MRAPSTLALLACLALACRGAAAACAAEKQCVGVACGDSYAAAASSFPYTVDYITTGSVDTTTFHFKVCSTACDPSSPTCQPLKAFRLRLANAVLAKPSDFLEGPTEGTIAATCADGGAGWWLRGAELGFLAEAPVSAECEKFEVTVFNQPGGEAPMPLSELCEQGVQIVRPDGTVAFDQAAEGASCLFTLELADGTAGVGALAEAGAEKPVVPPTTVPPRVPAPTPRPTPYYYGAGARRLQQAPFVRSLLAATYYYGTRRLAGVMPAARADEPLAFATRRLMEASVVPLPARLASRLPSHLAAPGRALAGYYYGGEHRRSLMSVGASGRTLSAYGGYYGSEHRRSLLSAPTFGRALSSYYYGSGAGHRRSLMSVGASGRTLSAYGGYYGSEHRRSLLSAPTLGRTLSSYYYGGAGHRRSLMSVGASARTLTSYGGYYGSEHRRSLLSAPTFGRGLAAYGGYYGSEHRRSLLSAPMFGRGLAAYGGYYGSEHRRSLLSAGSTRQLAGYGGYYGSGSHRRSLLSAGAGGRVLAAYGGYYGSHRRSLMSVGAEAGLGRSLLSSGYGYYGQRRLAQAGTFLGARRLAAYGGYYSAR